MSSMAVVVALALFERVLEHVGAHLLACYLPCPVG